MKKIDAVKNHIVNHKEAYISGGVALVVGVAVGVVVASHHSMIGESSASNTAGLFNWKPVANNVVIAQIASPGNAGNVIQCLESKIIYPSQRSAALAMDIDPSIISKHLRGIMDDAKGYHFSLIREGKF